MNMLSIIIERIAAVLLSLGIGIFFLVFGILMAWLVGMGLFMCGHVVFGILGLGWLFEDMMEYLEGKWERFHDNLRERITRKRRQRAERERERNRHIQLAEQSLKE